MQSMSENDAMLDERMLLEAARDARKKAYAPYSRFLVGAAILDDQGKLHKGCNVENAAYPQSQCAEATAIGNMISNGSKKILEIVVIGSGNLLCSPCGGCRQRIREFASLDTKIHMCNEQGHMKTSTLEELLPDSFGPENL